MSGVTGNKGYGLGVVGVSFKMRKRRETGEETPTAPQVFLYPCVQQKMWDMAINFAGEGRGRGEHGNVKGITSVGLANGMP
jgi:hypothetical protein